MRDRQRERERERQRHRQREKQASCRESDVGLNSRTPGSHPGLKAGAKSLSHPGIPLSFYLNSSQLTYSVILVSGVQYSDSTLAQNTQSKCSFLDQRSFYCIYVSQMRFDFRYVKKEIIQGNPHRLSFKNSVLHLERLHWKKNSCWRRKTHCLHEHVNIFTPNLCNRTIIRSCEAFQYITQSQVGTSPLFSRKD